MHPRESTTDDILTEATRRIVERFHPARVLLFGSRARGHARADADYDLVVMFDGQVEPWALTGAVRNAIGDLPAAFDVVVTSRALWDRYAAVPVSFEHRATREGKVVFDAAA